MEIQQLYDSVKKAGLSKYRKRAATEAINWRLSIEDRFQIDEIKVQMVLNRHNDKLPTI